MKNIIAIILCLALVPMLIAANKHDVVGRSAAPTAKTKGARYVATPSYKIGQVQYRPAIRQPLILFAEDPGDPGFGPLIKPDPLWDTTLTHMVGPGNFGWFGPTTSTTEDGPDLATMQGYDLVIWNCYDYWWSPPALTTNDQNNIQDYINGGGMVWLLGHDIPWSGVPLSWLLTNFHLQSVIEDYVFGEPTLNIQGLAEIAGISLTITSDYPNNDFFSDDLTPDANAHHVIFDVDSATYPAIFSDDNTTSFWTMDGRSPNPVANWEQMVNDMLEAFGVLGPAAFWDFEDGWQGWTHTSAQTFPAAWSVVTTTYPGGPYWTYQPPPDAGDSAFIIDSDASGMGVTVVDTAMSPAVGNPGYVLLKWGMFLQNDDMQVLLREFTAGAWGSWNVVFSYSGTTGPQWDSVDVSAYTGDSLQVAFQYDDGGSWLYGATFDNVGFYLPPVHDVACTEVASPPEGGIAPGDYDVIGRIRNFGDDAETFDVTANVYDTLDAWNLIFTQTVTFTDFPVDGDSLYNFGLVTFLEDKIYYTEIFTLLAGDNNPGNDTSAIYSNTTTFDLVWDFETGWQYWTHTNGQPFPVGWDVLESQYIYPEWTPPDAGDSCMWIDSDAAGSGGPWVQDTALSPVIVPDATTEWLKWGVGYWHLGSQFMVVGVKYFDGAGWTAVPLRTYNADFGPAWDSVDVSAYNTYDSIQVYFYFDDMNGWNWLASFDNVMINGYTGIAEEPISQEPLVFGFAPNMSTVTKHPVISYTTTTRGKECLKVYDNTGRLIRTLVDRPMEAAGTKTVYWNGMDDNGRAVANGVYFFRLEAEGKVDTRKMILVR